jgi:hypothetical protein
VIFGEHNEHGFLGAPIAKHVIETYFAKKEGRPLPVLPAKGAPPAPKDEDPDVPGVLSDGDVVAAVAPEPRPLN